MMLHSIIIHFLFVTSIVYSELDVDTKLDDSNQSKNQTATTSEICNAYLIPSLIPMAGRGVVSGKHYRKKQRIELVPTIAISNKITSVTQLQNYVFSTEEDDYDMICLGVGSLYNHHQSESVQHYWNSDQVVTFSSTLKYPYTTFTKTLYNTLRSVQLGEELFVNYGEGWFDNRFHTENTNNSTTNDDIVLIDEYVDKRIRNDYDSIANDGTDEYTNIYDEYSNSYDDSDGYDETDSTTDINIHDINGIDNSTMNNVTYIEEADLVTYGHCINNVYVSTSTIPSTGSGLFANKDFMINDTVTISPVLFLPKDIILKEPGVLLNYCYGSKDSNILLFPLNYGSIINHSPNIIPPIISPALTSDFASTSQKQQQHEQQQQHAQVSVANVKIEWYDWNQASIAMQNKYSNDSGNNNTINYMELSRILNKSTEELLKYSFAPLDIVYKAVNPINKHEEIFLNYGEQWIKNYFIHMKNLDIIANLYNKTCDNMLDNKNNNFCSIDDNDADIDQTSVLKPRFRQFIELPVDFYPKHWYTVIN